MVQYWKSEVEVEHGVFFQKRFPQITGKQQILTYGIEKVLFLGLSMKN